MISISARGKERMGVRWPVSAIETGDDADAEGHASGSIDISDK
jgi:hypothetical protein